jgi:hypothetical protein
MDYINQHDLIIRPSYDCDQSEALKRQFVEHENLIKKLNFSIDNNRIRQLNATQKSFFTKVSEQYVSLDWSKRLALGLLVIGIGCMFTISIWLSAVIYIGFSILCFEHSYKNDLYQAAIIEDVVELQQELQSIIVHIDTIKMSLSQIMTHLYNLDLELAQSHTLYQAQIQEFKFQIEQKQTIITNLTETTKTLKISLSTYKEEWDKASELITHNEQCLEQETNSLRENNAVLEETIAKLNAEIKKLQEISVLFEEEVEPTTSHRV